MSYSTSKARLSDSVESMKNDAADVQDTVTRSATELADTMSTKLKSVGVDTDAMVNAAKDKSTELQRLIADELHERPMRALGIAAAVGLFVGLLSTR